ncbi:uncharacterized protein LOC111031296, partial [Myzus persicae]|uniref:uncharacterized protein LOC111031296 n=1 Tax=Myzus persicae TaxID=13164 RepID=UPI000B933716
MVSRANCSQYEDAAVSDYGKNSIWGCSSLFWNLDSDPPHASKFLNRRLLNPPPIGKNCTVYKSLSSKYGTKPTHQNHTKKVIQEPLQNTNIMDNCGGSQFSRKYLSAVKRLDEIVATSGKCLQYNLLSTAGLMPCMVYTYNAICGDMETCGCGSSVDEAIEDAATKMLDKISSNPLQDDDYSLSSMNSLRHESKFNVKSNNYIGKLQEYCQAHGLDIPKYEYHQDNDIKNKRYMHSVICSTGPYKSTGVGISKQIAKNHSARLTYNQINSYDTMINWTSASDARKEKPIDFGQGLSTNDSKNDAVNIALDHIYHGRNEITMSTNYVGTLQEKCSANGWELPKYEFHQEHSKEINKLFYSVICTAGPHKSRGIGNSKQIAKNQAAKFVYDQINSDQQKTSTLHTNFTRDKAKKSNTRNMRDFDPYESIHQFKLWCNQLSSSNKECVQILKRCYSLDFLEIDIRPFEFLTKLAKQENFCATYVRCSDNINGAKAYGIINIPVTTKNVIMFIGDGKTEAEAQNSIAKKILDFI